MSSMAKLAKTCIVSLLTLLASNWQVLQNFRSDDCCLAKIESTGFSVSGFRFRVDAQIASLGVLVYIV